MRRKGHPRTIQAPIVRGPLRIVVGVAEFVHEGRDYNYRLRLKCGHFVFRNLLRSYKGGAHPSAVRCGACRRAPVGRRVLQGLPREIYAPLKTSVR